MSGSRRAEILAAPVETRVLKEWQPSPELQTLCGECKRMLFVIEKDAFSNIKNHLPRDDAGSVIRNLAVRYLRRGCTLKQIEALFQALGWKDEQLRFVTRIVEGARKFPKGKPDPPVELLPQHLEEYDRAMLGEAVSAEASSRMPKLHSLRERLARPSRVTEWRIEELQQIGHRTILAAQYKAGKTTKICNLVRSLVDGTPYLDRYEVSSVEGLVAVFDFEMLEDDPGQLDEWYRVIGVEADDRVLLIPMRGRASTFDITKADVRAQWAAQLRERGVSYLILDCLRPVLDALGLSEHSEAGVFLEALDELLCDAGIREALVVHHMGHTKQRSRGDSRILDWPDVNWTLARASDDPASERFFKAYGRGVDVWETKLGFNEQTLRLAAVEGSRKKRNVEPVLKEVLDYLKKHGEKDTTAKAIEAALKESQHSRADVREAIKLGVTREQILESHGEGKKGGNALRLPGQLSLLDGGEGTDETPGAM